MLKFGSARTGTRCYVAFSGYLKVPVVMCSRCTSLKSGIGGFKGRKLMAGDYVEERIHRLYLPFFLSRKLPPPDYQNDNGVLRVIMGPQDGSFSRQGIETFLNSEYTVTGEFDRMGCRLDGPIIAPKKSSDIISDGIALGAVQVPTAGKPTVLLADRQTTGGYAKIATMISVDIPRLVQKKTNEKIRFRAVTIQEAQKLYLQEINELEHLRRIIHTPCKEVLEVRQVAKRLQRLYADAETQRYF